MQIVLENGSNNVYKLVLAWF